MTVATAGAGEGEDHERDVDPFAGTDAGGGDESGDGMISARVTVCSCRLGS